MSILRGEEMGDTRANVVPANGSGFAGPMTGSVGDP